VVVVVVVKARQRKGLVWMGWPGADRRAGHVGRIEEGGRSSQESGHGHDTLHTLDRHTQPCAERYKRQGLHCAGPAWAR